MKTAEKGLEFLCVEEENLKFDGSITMTALHVAFTFTDKMNKVLFKMLTITIHSLQNYGTNM